MSERDPNELVRQFNSDEWRKPELSPKQKLGEILLRYIDRLNDEVPEDDWRKVVGLMLEEANEALDDAAPTPPETTDENPSASISSAETDKSEPAPAAWLGQCHHEEGSIEVYGATRQSVEWQTQGSGWPSALTTITPLYPRAALHADPLRREPVNDEALEQARHMMEGHRPGHREYKVAAELLRLAALLEKHA